MVAVADAVNGGVPLSVTTVVIRLVPGLCVWVWLMLLAGKDSVTGAAEVSLAV